MKITIDISDEEIKQEVFTLLTHRLADQIFNSRYSNPDERAYRRILKEGVNAVLKEHTDEILEKCVPQAVDYIGKKGAKKLADLAGFFGKDENK